MSENFTLKKDFIFSRLFSKKGNESFLIDFLESILEIKIDKIKIIQEARLPKTFIKNKYGVLDIKATLNDGIIVDIEMQFGKDINIIKRTSFYAAKLMGEQLEAGQKYKEIEDIVMINILNYNMFDVEEYHNKTVMVLKNHKDYELDQPVTYHFIELPKFRKKKPNLDNKLEQWLSFIDGEDKGAIKLAIEKNKEIEKANVEWEYLTGDAELKRIEELWFKWELDQNSLRDVMETEAREKGIKEGRVQGEKNEKIKIAKEMLKSGVSKKDIIKYTKLTKEEIEKIEREEI